MVSRAIVIPTRKPSFLRGCDLKSEKWKVPRTPTPQSLLHIGNAHALSSQLDRIRAGLLAMKMGLRRFVQFQNNFFFCSVNLSGWFYQAQMTSLHKVI